MIRRLQGLTGRLAQEGLVRNVAVLAGGTAFAQLLSIAASPILTRLYSPDDFGLVTVYSSILSILVLIASMRYELAIPLPASDVTALSLLVVALMSVLGLGVISTVFLLLYGTQLASVLGATALIPYLWMVPIGVLGAGAYQALNYWAVRKKTYAIITRTRVSQSLAQLLVQVVLGFLGAGPIGLLLGDLARRMAGSSTLAFAVFRREGEWKQVDRRSVSAAAWEYRKFPLISSWSALMNSVGLQLPSLFLAAFFGNSVVGLFSLGQRLLSIPLTLIGQALGQVFLQEAAERAHEDPDRLLSLFNAVTMRLVKLVFIPATGLFIGAPWAFSLVFGAEWYEAGVITRLLVPVFVCQFVITPVAQVFNVLDRQDLQLMWDALRLGVVLLCMWLAHYVGDAHLVISTYSIVLTAMYVGLYISFRRLLAKARSNR